MRCLPMLLALVLCVSNPAPAATYLVRADGTGDFPSIQAALYVAAEGDVIELADGIYTGESNRDLDFDGKALTLQSHSGDPEQCVIDCEGQFGPPRRAFLFDSGEGPNSVVRGIGVLNGRQERGGAIRCMNGAAPLIENCWFEGNQASLLGGAIAAVDDAASPRIVHCRFSANAAAAGGGVALRDDFDTTIEQCEFIDNESWINGGGVFMVGGIATVSDCIFLGNVADIYSQASAGGLAIGSSTVVVERCEFGYNRVDAGSSGGGGIAIAWSQYDLIECLFYRNHAPDGSALYCDSESSGSISGCTFSHNRCISGGTVFMDESCSASLDHTIIAFSESGASVHLLAPVATLNCCDLYGNAGGDWVDPIADQLGVEGNLSADPLFCDPGADNFYLDAGSPCAAGNNPECGQIGALGVGCGATPAQPASWGAIKARYAGRELRK